MENETKMMLEFLHSECNRGGCGNCPLNMIAETEFCPLDEPDEIEKAFNGWLEKQEGKAE